ncbi:ubinuclein-1-like isoform X2 [Dioscorea cayenensis subsp. rotundata]|uniref:Ubinuclein-1-like isoform X2 n=1 Tax=Dioscorea cayennensis subsp. rotundata TaxID=55577 RepID=A0AB40B1W0_DIOCR|nr:ubinuclein-1-like isoform X2 [Dioscorea cayenensis subsp. rotundata]
MDDEKPAVAGPARVPTMVEGPPAASSSEPQKLAPVNDQRVRFTVELRPGETTIVSWKRLLKESGRGGGSAAVSSGVDPAFGGQVFSGANVQDAEGELKDGQPSNRFSAVIEKIERLYMGKHSSDEEELDDVPDDDEYDTEDSFIDDAELDEYFQVEKSTTKHNGYFVNKGKLERIEPSSSPNPEPKKRKRKDSTRNHSEKDGEHNLREPLNMGNMRIKSAARDVPSTGKKSIPSTVLTPFPEHNQETKNLKSKVNVPSIAHKKRTLDLDVNSENLLYMKTPYKVASTLPPESKDYDKQKAGLIPSRDSYKSRGPVESSDAMYPVPWDKAVPSQVESQPKKLSNGETDTEASMKIRRKERSRYSDFSDFNSSADIYHGQRMKEDAVAVRPKGTTLERAIRDLEKIVAACRPPDLNVQEIDPSTQAIKRRLPQEVKQKLAKVARLSVNHCKISKNNLIDRLMGILGHLVQRRTLKRNMKEMVELGLSAKQEKAYRFQQIKKEVNEMIRSQPSLLKSKVAEKQDGSADDFQEAPVTDEKRALKKAFIMDKALEDKICDLYDLYVEGMDEDKGPQSRKLYVELAELWPSGHMDNAGIKEAIYRSKQRRRATYTRHKVRDEERIKRKRLALATRPDETLSAQVRTGQERPAAESSSQLNILPDKQLSNHINAPLGRPTESTQHMSAQGHHFGSENYEKARGSGSTNIMLTEDGYYNVKKKVKRRPESDQGEIQVHPVKPSYQDGKERHKPPKQGDDPSSNNLYRPNLALPAPSVSEFQN